MNIPLNLWSVVVAAVAGMVVGAIWYGPLFGKKYMSAVGMDSWPQEKRDAMRKSMVKSYVLQFLLSLVTYYVLAMNIVWSGLPAWPAMVFAFFIWLGFILPIKLGETLWGGSKTLAWLNIGSQLISLVVAGAIIGAMN